MFELELASLGKLVVSILLGGLIGLERQMHGRPAGLRTHILVCMGATLVMMVGESFVGSVDPGRAVAGIVTGVGFLGAGVIVKSRDIVRGLTTAACIWFAATIGILVGQGLFLLAAVSSGLSVAVLTLLARVVRRLPSVRYYTAIVWTRGSDSTVSEQRSHEVLSGAGYRVVGHSLMTKHEDLTTRVTFRLQTRSAANPMSVVDRLSNLEGVTEVEWE
ncbi:MgtC/SapB family protein [Candidatus Bipolaricaulota bacterium]|nr:MgtC/SapB family protein [Candidatus Bipolaricaulota bacterium]